MRNAVFFMLLSTLASAQNVPYYPRSTQNNTDLGGINQNFEDLSSRPIDKLTTTITPSSCPAGQALTGAQYNKYGATIGGTCSVVASSSTGTGFWVQGGNDIHNTNPGMVNIIGGGGIDSNILQLGTSSTTWTWSFQNPVTAFAGNPFLALTDNNNGGLTFGLLDIPGGQRLMLWDETQPLRKLNTTGLYPAFGVYGDIEIGDIHAIAKNPMTYFMRVESGLAPTAVTQLFSAKNGVNDIDGGSQFVIAPSTQNATTPVSDGYLSAVAYGQSSGALSNAFEFKNRSGSGTVQQIWQSDSAGMKVKIGGVTVTGAVPTAIASSMNVDDSASVGRLIANGPSSTFGSMQFGSSNNTTTNIIGTIDGPNQRWGILAGTPSTTLDVNGNAQFGSGVTKSTFSTTGALTLATPLAYGSGGTNSSASFTQGSVIFAGASAFTQDNSNFFWDSSHVRLGIGLNNPNSPLNVQSTTSNLGWFENPSGAAQIYIVGTGATASWIFENGHGTNEWQVGNDASTNTEGVANSFFWTNYGTGTNAFAIRSSDSRAHFFGQLVTENKVGVSTAAPQSTLDVNGSAQFGTAGSVSTFTTTGSLTMPSGATITDLANVANTVLATNSSDQYTSLPLLGNGGLIIGSGVYPSTGTLTQGTGISITNAAGKITIADTNPTLAASSATLNGFGNTFTATAFGVCITTLTFTTNGNNVKITFSGAVANSSLTTALIGMAVLQDGAFFDNENTTTGFMLVDDNLGGSVPDDINGGFVHRTKTAPAAGSHSYCLSPRVNTATGSFDNSNVVNQFMIEEIP